MPAERELPATSAPTAILAEEFAGLRVDVAAVKAEICTLRADMSEATADRALFKAGMTEVKADMREVKANITTAMSDIIRLDVKTERMAAALAGVQADVQRLVQSMATKNDVAKILDVIEALAKKP